MSFDDRVYDAVRRVPHGRVASYGAIAAAAGYPGAARRVGRALRVAPDDLAVPWWRVINARGVITIPRHDHGAALQRALLRDEGVQVDEEGRVDMRTYGWPIDEPGDDPDDRPPDEPPEPPANTRRSVALAIHDPDGRLLLVRRPPDDEDLPLVWGLPAATLAAAETWADAARRAARDKLGVGVEPGALLNEGRKERPAYALEMRLYEARIVDGRPAVPQDVAGVTQYIDWRWGQPADLERAAGGGSLCSRLYLDRA